MNQNEPSGLDIFGVKPLAKAGEKVVNAAVDSAKILFDKICLPAAEEFGLLVKDRVSHWRAFNAAAIAAKAAPMITAGTKVHPRIAHEVIERGSWVQDEVLQSMWAGLLASSCTDKQSDSNILFTALLDKLTSVQARILYHICETANKYISSGGFPQADIIKMTSDELMDLTNEKDIHRLDRELDHLRSIELLASGTFGGGGGFDSESTIAYLRPSSLALHLYTKCQGFLGSPVEYWDLKHKPEPPKPETPNQSLEPTIILVTDAAAQPPRQV